MTELLKTSTGANLYKFAALLDENYQGFGSEYTERLKVFCGLCDLLIPMILSDDVLDQYQAEEVIFLATEVARLACQSEL